MAKLGAAQLKVLEAIAAGTGYGFDNANAVSAMALKLNPCFSRSAAARACWRPTR